MGARAKFIPIALISLFGINVHAQGIPYQLNPPAPNARVQFCPVPDGGYPCPTLTMVYSDSATTQVINQPISTGSSGNLSVYFAAGTSSVTVQFLGQGYGSQNRFVVSLGGGGVTSTTNLPGGSQIYVAASCPPAATNCFAVNKDATWVIDATFNATSTVTTTAGDITFACPGSVYPCSSIGTGSDVGKIAVGNTACSFSTAVNCTTYACPQTTISTVNSAHSVTLASACTGSSSGSISVFGWGHDDGAQLVAATNAMLAFQTAKSGVPVNLSLPCGAMMTSVNPFIGNQASIPASFSITGCGSGTVIVPLPKMNCNVGAGHGCLIDFPVATYATNGFTPAGVVRDITFYGLGQASHDPAATVSANSSGIFVNFQYGLDNVWVNGWLSADTVGTLKGITNIGGAMFNSGSFAGGEVACELRGSASTVATVHGGTCGGTNGNSYQVVQNANANDEVDLFGPYIQNSIAGFGLSIASGVLKVYGGTNLSSISATGGTLFLEETGISGGGLFAQGANIHLHGVNFTSSANLQNTVGGIVFDDCGNNLPFSSFTTFLAGNPRGTCSIVGVADVAGNHVLSAGFGTTATVTAVSGDTLSVSFTVNSSGTGQAASPTVTDTFALGGGGFWKAPNTGCMLQQIGGTFGVITNPVPSALSRTGVTWTFSGTPVAGQSYTFIRTCS